MTADSGMTRPPKSCARSASSRWSIPVWQIDSTAARTPSGPKQFVKQETMRFNGRASWSISRFSAEPHDGHGDFGAGVFDAEHFAPGQHIEQRRAADVTSPARREVRPVLGPLPLDLPAHQVLEVAERAEQAERELVADGAVGKSRRQEVHEHRQPRTVVVPLAMLWKIVSGDVPGRGD